MLVVYVRATSSHCGIPPTIIVLHHNPNTTLWVSETERVRGHMADTILEDGKMKKGMEQLF